MAFKLADLFVAISAPLGPLNATLGAVKTKLIGFSNVGLTVGKNIVSGISAALAGLGGTFAGFGGGVVGALGTGGVAGIVVGLTAIAAGLVKAGFMAGHLQEYFNKAELVFGSLVGRVVAGADEMAAKFGVVRAVFINATADIGLMLEAAGFSGKKVTDMSIQLAKLALDVKSGLEIPVEQTMAKIESGLAGNMRAVRTWGVDVSETHVKLKARLMGLWSGKGEMDQQTKTAVRYQLIIEGLNRYVGDLANSQHRLSQAFEGLKGRLENIFTTIGSVVAPILGFLIGGINEMIDSFAYVGKAILGPTRAVLEFFGLIDVKAAAAADAAMKAREAAIDVDNESRAANVAAEAAAAKALGTHVPAHHGPVGFREFSAKIAEAAAGGKDALQKKMLAVQQAQLLQLQKLNANKAGVPAVVPAVAI